MMVITITVPTEAKINLDKLMSAVSGEGVKVNIAGE